MYLRGAVFTFRVLAQQKDGVGGSSLLAFLPRRVGSYIHVPALISYLDVSFLF